MTLRNTRSEALNLRVSREEDQAVRRAAQLAATTRAAFSRAVVIGAALAVLEHAVDDDE